MLHHYCDKSSCWLEDFDDSELMMILLQHEGKPSLFFNLKDAFEQFLATEKQTLQQQAIAGDESLSEAADAWPGDLEALRRAGIILRFRGTGDPFGVGAVDWQKAIFCAGGQEGLTNALRLLDQFFLYKLGTQDFVGRQVNVQVHNSTGYALDALHTNSGFGNYTYPEPDVRMHVLSCAPPSGSKYLHMVVQVCNDSTVNLMWTGATYTFWQDIDKDVVRGAYIKDGEEVERGQGEFWLLMPSVDLSMHDTDTQVDNILQMGGFHRSAMCVRVEGAVPETGPVATFLGGLRAKSWVHFR